MNNPNPYEPPRAAMVNIYSSQSSKGKFLLMGLVAIQMLITLLFASTYFEIVRTGSATFMALLLCVVGSTSLYIATLLQFSKRQRGKIPFLVAAICLGFSVRSWRWFALGKIGAIVALFGAILGVCGWWLVHKGVKTNALSSPKEL